MDFSGAQTLMGTFKTFAIYAGAIICFGGLIFAGIRMMSGRFHFTAPSKELGIANRDLGTVQRIDGASQLSVKMDNGKSVSFDANQIRHFDHGYAVTSHSSQGLTAERVLVNIDTKTHPELINPRFAYVSVSRAAQDAQIFTNAASSLTASLSQAVTKTSAIEIPSLMGY
jgi:ATP-dependent exoDNAse (exonuclease V) alpha subunit